MRHSLAKDVLKVLNKSGSAENPVEVFCFSVHSCDKLLAVVIYAEEGLYKQTRNTKGTNPTF